MSGSMTEPHVRLPIYNGSAGAILWRRRRSRFIALAAALPIALSTGACSYKLGSVFSEEGKSETAGSVAAPDRATAMTAAGSADVDLAFAKQAAAEALGRTGDVSVPWENPKSGARGTICRR